VSEPPVFAALPPSEVEWEDLLVRYELAPRAVRLALDEDDPDTVRRGDLLRVLITNERLTAALFAAMREGRDFADPFGAPQVMMLPGDPQALAARFAELRGRNFAAVQRRGLEVWQWRTTTREFGEITAYQMIQRSVDLDAGTLGALRAGSGAPAC
jgi:hypothetical protein